MSVDVTRDSPTWQPPTDDTEESVTEALRDLARWLYRQLRPIRAPDLGREQAVFW